MLLMMDCKGPAAIMSASLDILGKAGGRQRTCSMGGNAMWARAPSRRRGRLRFQGRPETWAALEMASSDCATSSCRPRMPAHPIGLRSTLMQPPCPHTHQHTTRRERFQNAIDALANLVEPEWC